MGRLTKGYKEVGIRQSGETSLHPLVSTPWLKVGIAFILTCCCVSPLHSQTTPTTPSPASQASREKPNPKLKLRLPLPPQTGTPVGSNRSQIPGATRSPFSCNSTSIPLVALIANQGKDYTLHSHPRFWFYLPVFTAKITTLEFTLRNAANQTATYRIPFAANPTGLFRISLPKEAEFALQDGENYTWQLKLVCREENKVTRSYRVTGGIQKLATTPELELQLTQLSPLERYEFYRDNNLWYDAVDELAQLYLENTDNPVIKKEWQNLLRLLQLQDLSFQPPGG